LHTLKARK
jgi:hypothetical protein